jgi:hypothetical protein
MLEKPSGWQCMEGLKMLGQLCMGAQDISRVSEFKYLGFIVDTGLTWSAHISSVISKVKQRLYALRRSRFIVSREGRKLLFDAPIMPFLCN